MIAWLRRVLGLCQHKWKIIREKRVYEGHETEGRLPIGADFTLQCEHCGDIKTRRT